MDKKNTALGKRKKAGDDQIPSASPAKKAKNAVGKAVPKRGKKDQDQPKSAKQTKLTAREMKKKQKEEEKKEQAARQKKKAVPKKKKTQPVAKGGKKKSKDQDDDADEDKKKDNDDDKQEEQEEEEKKQQTKMVYGLKKGGAVVDTNLTNSQKYRVCVDGTTIFDKSLMYSDVGNNNNKFYIIQLLEDDSKSASTSRNYLFTRWGRVGQKGSQSLISFDSSRGKAQFTKKLFAKKNKGYRQIQITYDDDDDDQDDEDDQKDNEQTKKISSKLSKQVQSLMNLIFDVKVLDQTLKQIGYNAKKMPLGKLSEETIKQGYDWLNKIAQELKNQKISKANLQQLSSQFYSCIPHDFGRQHMSKFTIMTNDELKKKIETLDALKDMTVANKIIKKSKVQKKENPADSKYKQLECGIKALDRSSKQFQILKDYYQNTGQGFYQKTTVSQIFEINRKGQQTRFNSGKGKLDNHMLLWHGSRISNFGGILRQGLRIAPPEAPSAGYNFGKGLYFADMATKSLCYCRGGGSGSQLLILLVEVALGEPNIKLNFDFNAAKLPPGKDCTWGVGGEAPPENSYVEIEEGLMVPQGKGQVNPKGKYLGFNEFIVYDESQVRMRYLMRCKID